MLYILAGFLFIVNFSLYFLITYFRRRIKELEIANIEYSDMLYCPTLIVDWEKIGKRQPIMQVLDLSRYEDSGVVLLKMYDNNVTRKKYINEFPVVMTKRTLGKVKDSDLWTII